MRLNAFLARAGVASRRGADELIKGGRVVVNGELGQLNTAVADGDRVEVDGQVVAGQALRYVLLHKPRHVVTTVSDPGGRTTVVDLVGGDIRVVPVGRLDFDTTGLLVLTNDGELANRLAHPRYGVEKTYLVEVDGDPAPRAVKALARGVELDDGVTAPAKVRKLAPGLLEIVLHEGRNRQVRRMCEAVGHPAKTLHRSAYGGLELGTLKPGKWRNLSAAEVERLQRHGR
ncbi:MAG: pseudouridine synthase [Gaiellales bacterium]